MKKRKILIILGIITIIIIVFSINIIIQHNTSNIKLNDNSNVDSKKNNDNIDNKKNNDNIDNNNTYENKIDDKANEENSNGTTNNNIANNNTTSTKNKKQNPSNNNISSNNNNVSSSSNNKQDNVPANNNFNQNVDETKPSFPPSNPEQKKDIIDAIQQYDCGDMFVLNGTKCTYFLSNDALVRYTCNEGTLNGTKCDTTSTIEYTPNRYGVAAEICQPYSGSGAYNSCLCEKDGGTYNHTNQKCYKTIAIQRDANIEYYCVSGTILNGNKCQKYYETDAPFTLTCPSGYKLNGKYCEK